MKEDLKQFGKDALSFGQGLLSFGEDLLKLIPTPFANEIKDSLLKIVELVKNAKDNQKYCDDLFIRLSCATETIGMGLRYAPAGYKIGSKNIERYMNIVNETKFWVEKFNGSKKKMTRRLLNIL